MWRGVSVWFSPPFCTFISICLIVFPLVHSFNTRFCTIKVKNLLTLLLGSNFTVRGVVWVFFRVHFIISSDRRIQQDNLKTSRKSSCQLRFCFYSLLRSSSHGLFGCWTWTICSLPHLPPNNFNSNSNSNCNFNFQLHFPLEKQ